MQRVWAQWVHRLAHRLGWNRCTLILKDDGHYLRCTCGDETFFALRGHDFLTKIGF
jgi:hypothetical protein